MQILAEDKSIGLKIFIVQSFSLDPNEKYTYDNLTLSMDNPKDNVKLRLSYRYKKIPRFFDFCRQLEKTCNSKAVMQEMKSGRLHKFSRQFNKRLGIKEAASLKGYYAGITLPYDGMPKLCFGVVEDLPKTYRYTHISKYLMDFFSIDANFKQDIPDFSIQMPTRVFIKFREACFKARNALKKRTTHKNRRVTTECGCIS